MYFVYFVYFENGRFFKKRGQNVYKNHFPPKVQFYDRKYSYNASPKNNNFAAIKKSLACSFAVAKALFIVLL